MKYAKQLFRHAPEAVPAIYGDCHRTAIACLLDLDPREVPHFGAAAFDDPELFYKMEREFLRSRGLAKYDVVYSGEFTLEQVLEHIGALNPGVRYLLGGKSRNGTHHTVVGCGGRIEWDPALDDSGIVGPCTDGYYWVSVLTPIEMRAES